MARFTAGGVLAIALADGRRAYAVMLRDFPHLAFYSDKLGLEGLEALLPSPLFIVPVMRKAYSTGRWGKILNRLAESALPEIPLYFRQNVMDLEDCVLVGPG